jgi:hypothetical protein
MTKAATDQNKQNSIKPTDPLFNLSKERKGLLRDELFKQSTGWSISFIKNTAPAKEES